MYAWLGGKTLLAIVYTDRDPIPENITFYHISEDGNDLCHNDAPRLGIVGNVKATLEVLAEELERKISPHVVERNVTIAREAKAQQRGLREQAERAAANPRYSTDRCGAGDHAAVGGRNVARR